MTVPVPGTQKGKSVHGRDAFTAAFLVQTTDSGFQKVAERDTPRQLARIVAFIDQILPVNSRKAFGKHDAETKIARGQCNMFAA